MHSEYFGLTNDEVIKQKYLFGQNTIEEKKKNVLLTAFFEEIKNPVLLLLVLATIVSYFLGEHAEAIAILIVIVLNILFSLFQVYKADNAVKALKELISDKVVVIRSGQSIEIDATDLVPKDIVYLESGNKIPADIKILSNTSILANESILTGESMSVEKKVSDGEVGMLFMGTTLSFGEVYGEVVNIGPKTKFGEIASSIHDVSEKDTNLQRKLKELTKFLGLLGIVGSLFVFVLSLFHDKGLFESFLLTISLAVAVVPEGLPAVMTATLSIGVSIMAKKGMIMRRLDAIEGLGDITVLATDKTGTLTQNKMTVTNLWMRNTTHAKYLNNDEAVLLCFSLNVKVTEIPTVNGGFEYVGDPTEIALREYLNEEDIVKSKKLTVKIINSEPFSSETRVRKTTIEKDGKNIILINGAPETVLAMDKNLKQEEKEEILSEQQKQAASGLRTLAFAVAEDEDHVHFVGFASLKDPLRPGIKSAITDARSMGIRTVLITGDNALTAEAIAVEAGVVDTKGGYVTGDMISEMSDEQLKEVTSKINIYARISPDQKLKIIKSLQSSGEFVAMTGDGVNDAPALKQADVGVAMGKSGTDVAKEASDAIVTDDNYVTLVSGIKEGRLIIRRIELATMFFVAGNIGEFLYVFISLILNLPIITPLQILFINLITDAVPALALSFAPVKVSKESKDDKDKRLIKKSGYEYIAVSSLILAFTAIFATFTLRENQEMAKVGAFIIIIILQQVMLFDIWTGLIQHKRDLFKIFNKYILLATSITLVACLVLFNNESLRNIFEISKIPMHELTAAFIYGFGAYVAYVLSRINLKKV